MSLLIRNASEILTMTGGLGLLKNRSLFIDHGVVKGIGDARSFPARTRTIDARSCVVMPGFIDCHTHLVWAGSREEEFARRLAGVSYEQIAREGGGIMSTVERTRAADENELYRLARARLWTMIREGTTTVEIKSGYGLSCEEELKALRVIRRLQRTMPIDIVPTYLVHAVPRGLTRRAYVRQVTEEILPAVARQGIAEFCDIFCDATAFTRADSRRILSRARAYRMRLKIHADELANSGGANLAAELGCSSADHLIYATANAFRRMKAAGVMPVLLPGTSLYLAREKKPAVQLLSRAHIPFALASDYNPGTCLIYALPRIVALACLRYGVDIESALLGITRHAARALARKRHAGMIRIGAPADIVILRVDTYRKIAYLFGEDLVAHVIKKGTIIYGKNR